MAEVISVCPRRHPISIDLSVKEAVDEFRRARRFGRLYFLLDFTKSDRS